ncbi:MAG: hypothetical protein H0X34_12685 [Chthoniobacterales bacterium]|nr:hypothetical protein [Chthoniobacterales bacterium]
MKRLVTTLTSAAGLWVGGCASDTSPAEAVQEHLQRAAAGEGQLGPIDRTDDPFINPRVGDTTPGHP